MSIDDLKNDLNVLSRRKSRQQVVPYERSAATELVADSRASFRRTSPICSANPSAVNSDVMKIVLQSCIGLEQRLKEMATLPKEKGHVDGYVYGMEIVPRPKQQGADEIVFDCVKIGRSVNPLQREASARTWLSPFGEIRDQFPFLKMREGFRLWVSNYEMVEKAIHTCLAGSRIHPEHEWFRCTKEEAIAAVMAVMSR